jgi:DNA replication protein DnaC
MSGTRHWIDEFRCTGCDGASKRAVPARFRWARIRPQTESLFRERIVNQTAWPRTVEAAQLARVIWRGPSGSGKTSLACAALCARDDRAFFAPSWELARARAKWPLGEGDPPIVEQAKRSSVLLVDDLGTEVGDFATICEVVFDRYDRDQPTWVTTWMSHKGIQERYGDGFARRLFEGSRIVECGP